MGNLEKEHINQERIMKDTSDKRAIIIGATSGIGRAVAERLLSEGWTLGIAGRRTERLEEIRIRYGEDRVRIARMDITREDSVEALDSLLCEMGRVDLFLHVSGIGYQNRELDEDKEKRTIETNCVGMVRIVSHFLNHVRSKAGEGLYSPSSKVRIAVVSSIAGTRGMGTAPSYSASKSMQSSYVTALSQLCRMEGIPAVFSDIRPGFVLTEILSPVKKHPMAMNVETAAGYIVRGLEKGRRVITFDWKFVLAVAIWRMVPRPLWERITFIKS